MPDSATVLVPMFTRLRCGLIWLSPTLVSAAKYCALSPPVPAPLVVAVTGLLATERLPAASSAITV
jgi:hypothetical protein